MKTALLYLLRAFIIFLILLPILVPDVPDERKFQTPKNVSVFVPAETSLNASLRVTLRSQIEASLGPDVELNFTRYGKPEGNRVLDFEELGTLITKNEGIGVIYTSPNLWGPAAKKFAAQLEKTRAFKEERLFWIVPEQAQSRIQNNSYIAVSEIFLPAMNFLGDESIANVEILGKANPGEKVEGEIVIRSGESILSSRTFSVTASESGLIKAVENVPLTFIKAGTQILSVTLNSEMSRPPLDTASTTVNVTHSKATLLHIAVGPDWSLRNLRQKLKFWPNLDLLSYYILREMTDDMSIPPTQLSLIEFPTDKLFGSELPNFHGIIAQNFPLDHYLNPQESENLVEYVKSGGRLAIVSGPLSFESQDPNIASLSPCENKPQFDTENTYVWEPGQADLSGNETFSKHMGQIATRATAIGCAPKSGALILAHTKEGKHPTVLAYPVEKGLVVAILSGDWHTSPMQTELVTESDKAKALLGANASEALFQWMVEFLQRRQDSALRPPDLAGPRIYSQDDALLIRSRGATRLDRALVLLSQDNVLAEGRVKHLEFLDMDAMILDRPISASLLGAKDGGQTLLPLQVNFKDADRASLRTRSVMWPILEQSSRQAENLPNPNLILNIRQISNAAKSEVAEQKSSIETRIPLLEAYPWLLALCLAALAVEQFLSHILGYGKKPRPGALT